MSSRRLTPAYKVFVVLLRPLLRAIAKRDYQHVERLPREGGFILAPNHVTYVDPLVVALFAYETRNPPFFLAKEALFRIPVFGKLLGAADQIPVYRGGQQAREAYSGGVQALRDGKCLVVFPEGTLTRDPSQWPMVGKTGAARLALATRCPVVPIAQWGAQEILGTYEKSVHLLPRKTTHVRVGEPVDLSDLYDQPMTATLLREATERIMTAITRELEVLRGEPAPVGRYDPKSAGVSQTGNFKRDGLESDGGRS
ncbi:MAG TPA: lysophospholipid acyltransferase family protein [Dermatophilaceae bacterium]|nr:lysophospholipid acyltransferase family protein [Dermatophilaceae bacterium]